MKATRAFKEARPRKQRRKVGKELDIEKYFLCKVMLNCFFAQVNFLSSRIEFFALYVISSMERKEYFSMSTVQKYLLTFFANKEMGSFFLYLTLKFS